MPSPRQTQRETPAAYDAAEPGCTGRRPLAAMFGPLASCIFKRELKPWCPVRPVPVADEKPPAFKIGGLDLPMVTYEGACAAGVERLAALLVGHFGPSPSR